jgi:hypothetical protein
MKRNFTFFLIALLSGFLSVNGQTSAHSSTPASQVLLKYFSIVTTREAVALYWQTSVELKNNYFEIQRSENGFPFKTIALMFAREEGENGGDYRFTDETPFILNANEVIYRIVQVSMDGKSSFLASEKIHPNRLTPTGTVQIGPDPVQYALQLNFETEMTREISLKIYSQSGQMLYTTKLRTNPGFNMFSVYEMNRFVPGNYMVELSDNRKVMNRQTIVKL